MNTKYTATLTDGTEVRFGSKHLKTHVVEVTSDGTPGILSRHGSLALAEKAARSARNRPDIWTNVHILPVRPA